MKKSILGVILTLYIITAFFQCVAGAEIIDSGNCGSRGSNVSWTLDDEGTLTISGTGEIADNYTDWDFSEVKKLVVENGITRIGNSAFGICRNLTDVSLPDSIISIGEWAFSECRTLTSIIIPNSVTDIGIGAFEHCHELANVTISENLNSLSKGIFSDCRSLTNIQIPEKIESIDETAFYNCKALTDIEVHPNNSNYCSENGILFNKNKTKLLIYPICKSHVEYVIPEGVTELGKFAFYNCTALTDITIPSSMTSLKGLSLNSCTALTNIITSNDNPQYSSNDGVLFNKSGTVLIKYPSGKQDEEYIIPEGVTDIDSDAFNGSQILKTVKIPDSMKVIGDNAFCDCRKLSDINFPNGVETIDYHAFENCNRLTSIIIPNSVTSIGHFAFADCDSLKSIVLSDNITNIKAKTFQYCVSLTEITIPKSVTSIENNAFYRCDAMTDIYYSGTTDDWGKISVNTGNNTIENAKLHCIYPKFKITENKIIQNISDFSGSATVIIAHFQDGVLERITYETIYLEASQEFSLSDVESGDKVFVWNSIEGMMPLTE